MQQADEHYLIQPNLFDHSQCIFFYLVDSKFGTIMPTDGPHYSCIIQFAGYLTLLIFLTLIYN